MALYVRGPKRSHFPIIGRDRRGVVILDWPGPKESIDQGGEASERKVAVAAVVLGRIHTVPLATLRPSFWVAAGVLRVEAFRSVGGER